MPSFPRCPEWGRLLAQVRVSPQEVLWTERSYLVKGYAPFWGSSQRRWLVCCGDTDLALYLFCHLSSKAPNGMGCSLWGSYTTARLSLNPVPSPSLPAVLFTREVPNKPAHKPLFWSISQGTWPKTVVFQSTWLSSSFALGKSHIIFFLIKSYIFIPLFPPICILLYFDAWKSFLDHLLSYFSVTILYKLKFNLKFNLIVNIGFYVLNSSRLGYHCTNS